MGLRYRQQTRPRMVIAGPTTGQRLRWDKSTEERALTDRAVTSCCPPPVIRAIPRPAARVLMQRPRSCGSRQPVVDRFWARTTEPRWDQVPEVGCQHYIWTD